VEFVWEGFPVIDIGIGVEVQMGRELLDHPGSGTYRLTWRIVKDWDNQEDEAVISNICFEY